MVVLLSPFNSVGIAFGIPGDLISRRYAFSARQITKINQGESMTNMVGSQMAKNSISALRLAIVALAFISSTAQALHFEPTDEIQIDLDTTLAYGSMWRVEDQEKSKMGLGMPRIDTWGMPGNATDSFEFVDAVMMWNSDDGNRNFDKGDQVSNRIAVTSEMDLKYSNMGFFLRGQIFHDSVYFEETSWDGEGWDYWGDPVNDPLYGLGGNCAGNVPLSTCGAYVGPETINNAVADRSITDPAHFSDDVKDRHGYDARFLDAYIYGLFPIGEHTLDLRVGRQVISWGESLMLQGGISFAQNKIDAAAATSPGVTLKEIFLPIGAVYGQIDLTESVTMEAYWQYEWEPSELFATGSYFEAQDFLESDLFLTNANIRNNCGFGFYDPNNPTVMGITSPEGYTAYYNTLGGASCYVDANGAQDVPAFPAGFGLEAQVDSNAMARADDIEPDHPSDQFGLAFRFLLEGGSEAGIYLLKYHDKYPSLWAGNYGAELNFTPTFIGYTDATGCKGSSCVSGINTARYTVEYAEDLQLIGLTFNTVISDIQFGFELTYRHNQPIVPACTMEMLAQTVAGPTADLVDNTTGLPGADNKIDNPNAIYSPCKDPSWAYITAKSGADPTLPFTPAGQPAWITPTTSEKLFSWPTEAEVFGYNIGMTMLLPSSPLWDTGFLVGEIGGWQVGSGFEDEDLKFSDIGGFTQEGYGISFIVLPQYKNVMEGVDLTIPFFVNYTIEGSFSYFNYNEGALWYSVGAEAIYLSNTTFGVNYNSYHGANNMWRDRDNVSFNVKYTF